jgi:hypothetical protein
MKTYHLLTALAGSALLLSGAAADAQHRDRHHQGGGGHRASMMLRAADANGDNSVTRAEINDLQVEMFEWMDRNGDGFLDAADRSPMHQRLAAIGAEHRAERGDDGEQRRRGRGRGRGRGSDGEDHIRAADVNDDQRVSRDEYLGMEHPGFDRLDANDDDVISPDELDAAVEERQNRREGRRQWWRD